MAADREVYIHDPEGQGASQMKLLTIAIGTSRNMYTVVELPELAKS